MFYGVWVYVACCLLQVVLLDFMLFDFRLVFGYYFDYNLGWLGALAFGWCCYFLLFVIVCGLGLIGWVLICCLFDGSCLVAYVVYVGFAYSVYFGFLGVCADLVVLLGGLSFPFVSVWFTLVYLLLIKFITFTCWFCDGFGWSLLIMVGLPTRGVFLCVWVFGF